MKVKILFLLVLVKLVALNELQALHLIGGNLSYTFIAKVGNNYRYKIKMTMYRDCQSSNGPAKEFDKQIKIGFYEKQGKFR